ncbi:hypothetical protein [Stenotrophomonas maltophilia]|uniref:hypothetical protein n=1 Tax=Stenotrophomonas maltophilia TaxID=40324 RepID=UPI002893D7D2|nr:hypothetical protein [Stenotrophomonas maltophilia]MDT3487237.1 hypothetical protein [Stenotrophomonas maltophilia]
MVDHQKAAQLFESARALAYDTPAIGRKLSGNCVTVHYGMLGAARELFGPGVELVVGYIEVAGRAYFHFTNDEVESWRAGITKRNYNLHSWLSVHGDVLDLTLAPTFHENEPHLIPADLTYIDLRIASEHGIVHKARLMGDRIPIELGLFR